MMKRTNSKRLSLKSARKKRKLSQQQCAEKVGISRSFYTQIENGTRNPGFETILKISEVLDLDFGEWK